MEEFLGLLEAEDEQGNIDKNVPVFVKMNKTLDESGLLTGEVILQCQYDTGMVAMYRHSDGIDPLQLIPTTIYPLLSLYVDEKTIEGIKASVKAKTDLLDKQLKGEFDKALKVLKGKGFENIVPSAWV